MNITKLGHCCLLIEEKGLRILTDPGAYSTGQNEIKNIDVVLITHEHADHLHVDSLKTVLKNNPKAQVITNKGVAKILDKEKIPHSLLTDGMHTTINNVIIEGFGKKHAEIHPAVPVVDNTGYFIANRFFYPGDAFTNPGKHVEILALPVAGPWMKIAEAIAYAEEVKPKICFPVHDGMLQPGRLGPVHMLPGKVLPSKGIQFKGLEEGKPEKF
ncbi:MBL fold metallo-hydrolase [Candidatus Woesearchaeota archaeon]|nr:MBL fold metallo-hydrolase [Candidatus Woesearchaeota archaeon]